MEIFDIINEVYPIDDSVGKAIRAVARRREFPKGATILSEGEVRDEVFFVEKGLLRAFYYQDEREITSWLASEGRFIWPLPSYLLCRPSPETIQMLEPSTLLIINRHDIEVLKKRFIVMIELERKIMERYLYLYEQRIRLLLTPKLEKRLEAFQNLFPGYYERVPLRYTATYLGMDPATLSRVRARFKRGTLTKKKD